MHWLEGRVLQNDIDLDTLAFPEPEFVMRLPRAEDSDRACMPTMMPHALPDQATRRILGMKHR